MPGLGCRAKGGKMSKMGFGDSVRVRLRVSNFQN
jgi:hypothetical protein